MVGCFFRLAGWQKVGEGKRCSYRRNHIPRAEADRILSATGGRKQTSSRSLAPLSPRQLCARVASSECRRRKVTSFLTDREIRRIPLISSSLSPSRAHRCSLVSQVLKSHIRTDTVLSLSLRSLGKKFRFNKHRQKDLFARFSATHTSVCVCASGVCVKMCLAAAPAVQTPAQVKQTILRLTELFPGRLPGRRLDVNSVTDQSKFGAGGVGIEKSQSLKCDYFSGLSLYYDYAKYTMFSTM